MNTAVYIRVSTEEQVKEGFSIAAQKEKLGAFVRSQGWSIHEIYIDEGFSAKNTSRPQLTRLLNDLKTGEIQVVLVYRLDRLTRSVLDLYHLLHLFDQYDVRFKSCTEVYDTTTAIGRLFITLVAALAQWERENLAERVKLGMGQMARERKRPGGPPPFGYVLHEGMLVIQPQEAETVRFIFQLYLTGSSVKRIAAELNQIGTLSRTGSKWSQATISHMLQNHAYYGALRWNYAEAGRKVNSPDQWIISEHVHSAVIDRSTFEQIQRLLQRRQRRHPREVGSDYMFTGVLFCARCGASMYGKTSHTRNKQGKTYQNRYYLCKNRTTANCRAPSIREEILEQSFLSLISPYFQKSFVESFDLTVPIPSSDTEEQRQRLEKKRLRWDHAYLEGLLPLERYRMKLIELDQAEDELRVQSTRSQPVSPTVLTHYLQQIELVWSHASLAERKQLVTVLVCRLVAEAYTKPHVNRTIHSPVRITELLLH